MGGHPSPPPPPFSILPPQTHPCLLETECWPLNMALVVAPKVVPWQNQPGLTTKDLPPGPQAPELATIASHLHHFLDVFHQECLIQLGFGS